MDQIADSTELTKQECERIVNSLFAAITEALEAGERVEISRVRHFQSERQGSPSGAQSSHRGNGLGTRQ